MGVPASPNNFRTTSHGSSTASTLPSASQITQFAARLTTLHPSSGYRAAT